MLDTLALFYSMCGMALKGLQKDGRKQGPLYF